MLKKFLNNQDGNYAVIFSLMMLPILGAVAMSVDFANLSRLKFDLSSSIDTAGSAVALAYQDGTTDETALKALAQKYFDENFDPNYKSYATVSIILPNPTSTVAAERDLRTKATLIYHPYFGPMMAALTNSPASRYVTVVEQNSMKLQMRAEIALVLDNSGSMTDVVSGGQTRFDLLKQASKKLVQDTISVTSTLKGLKAPVRFSLVPFAGSVNIGTTYVPDPKNSPTATASVTTATWFDKRGISPIHHEHLNWGTKGAANPTGYFSDAADGAKLDLLGNPLTRLSIRAALKYQKNGSATSTCLVSKMSSGCAVYTRTGATLAAAATDNPSKFAWTGCIESRPYPYNLQDDAGAAGTPKTLFVPYFAPDEFNAARYDGSNTKASLAYNNWWPDRTTDTTGVTASNTSLSASGTVTTAGARTRETNVAKYFQEQPYQLGQMTFNTGDGPNSGCTTKPIMALTEDTSALTTAIDNMVPLGATNVTEGMAWGWRTVSSAAPFTEGNPETRQDINKVVIVVTDGRNTYYTPGSLGATDYALNQSIYSAQGFPAWNGNNGTAIAAAASSTNKGRIFEGTTQSFNSYNNTNYSTAMIAQMNALCTNIKNSKVMLMTIGLDLDPSADAAMITALSACAGNSRYRKESDGVTAKKLFWNATSSTLTSAFNEITQELSNLRFTG